MEGLSLSFFVVVVVALAEVSSVELGSTVARERYFIKGYCQLFVCRSICGTSLLEGPGQHLQLLYFNLKTTQFSQKMFANVSHSENIFWEKSYIKKCHFEPFCFLVNCFLLRRELTVKIKVFKKAIISCFFVLNLLFVISRHNTLLIVIDMK